MKRLLLLLMLAAPVQATTYYISSTGSDSNNGTTPALAFGTFQTAVNSMACGDDLIVIANGQYVQDSGTAFPYFANCSKQSHVKTSKLANLAPPGYRTNPTRDSANYGKIAMYQGGWTMFNEVHGGGVINAANISQGTFSGCSLSNITPINGSGISTFTITNCYGGLMHFQNGTQIEMEIDSQGNNGFVSALPAPINQFQVYYVRQCQGSPSCGSSNNGNYTTFQISTAVIGGTSVSISTCSSINCSITSVNVAQPLAISVAASSFTVPDDFIPCGAPGAGNNICYQNGTAVTFNSVGFQALGAVLPAPLKANTIYYVVNLSARGFQVALTPGGAPITLTAMGTGPLTVASVQSPSQWVFQGLEFYYAGTYTSYGMIEIGSGLENSTLSLTNHVEVDRCYFHDNPASFYGNARGLVDNGAYVNIHDSYISGARNGEAQAIAGWGAYGPTVIQNNFLEGVGENTLYGGASNNTGLPNENHLFIGNYYYKPPMWKITPNTVVNAPSNGVASGPCWWDNTDPNYVGGEFYVDNGPIFQTVMNANVTGGQCANIQPVMTGGSITSLNILDGGGPADGCAPYTSSFTVTGSSLAVQTGSGFSVVFTTNSAGQIAGYNSLVGGSGYTPTNGSTQWYQCNSSGQWAVAPSSPQFSNPLVKDMAEHKSGRYFTYIGNQFNYVWGQAQSGEFFNNSQEPGGGAALIANDNIVVVNNKLQHGFQFYLTLEYCSGEPAVPCPSAPGWHTYFNNIVSFDQDACGVLFQNARDVNGSYNPCGYQMYTTESSGPGLTTMTFNHNTLYAGTNWASQNSGSNPSNGAPPDLTFIGLNGGCAPSFGYQNQYVYENSIVAGDMQGDCNSKGGILSQDFTNSTYQNFATLNGTQTGYSSVGATNKWQNVAYPASTTTIGYVNAAANDFHLLATSSFSAQNVAATQLSTDGTDLGADVDMVNMMTSGVINGTPNWDVMAALNVKPGSSKAVFKYNAPNASTCTVTVYNSIVRIPANAVATVADSSNTSVTDATRRELLVQGLSPSTAYTYSLACGNGEIMVGNFATRATGTSTVQYAENFSSSYAVTYSTSPTLTPSTTLGAATSQLIPVSSNSVVYAQIAGGQTSILVAP